MFKNRKFASEQEGILAKLMAESFGTQFFFLPDKNISGKKVIENKVDLAWANEDFIALFFMCRSKRDHTKQIRHNIDQADAFLGRWKRNLNGGYNLDGKNIFGDQYSIPFVAMKKLIIFSVVSSKIGVIPVSVTEWTDKKIVLSIPEDLITWISSFRGTLVDLLYIIQAYFSSNADRSQDSILGYSLLKMISTSYPQSAIQNSYLQNGMVAVGVEDKQDYKFIFDRLMRCKSPDGQDQKSRVMMSQVFGDLKFSDYTTIAAAVCVLLKKSGAPKFDKFAVLALPNMHHTFVLNSINFSATEISMKRSTESACDACRIFGKSGASIIVTYANVGDFNEYRLPHLFAFISDTFQRQVDILFDGIRSLC